MPKRFLQVAEFLPPEIKEHLNKIPHEQRHHVQEIRLRVEKPVMLSLKSGDIVLPVVAKKADIERTFRNICDDSVHSHQNEIRQGFITLKGGIGRAHV